MERVRKVDVEKLPPEQIESISQQIGQAINDIVAKSAADIDRIASIYGLKAKFHLELTPLNSPEKSEE